MTTLRPQLTPSGYHESAGELRGLTGLRIVAAAWVVFFHFHFTPLPGVAQVVAVVGPLLTAGALGVDLFFVLSGFVIAYTYLDQLGPALRASTTARFVWARACRLWPAYALVFHVFGLWLAARWYFGSDSEIAFQAVQPVLSVGEYAQQLVMVQLWDNPRFDGASWVGSTWSISAEWLVYLLFPVAALGFFRLRKLPPAVLGAGSVAVMAPMAWAYLSTGSPYYDWSWLVRILCGFGGGALAYLAVRRLWSSGATASPAVRRVASGLAAGLPVLIAVGLLAGELYGPGRGGAVIALFPLLVGALALADRGPALILSRPWAVYGGRISYCLYLVHIPMLEVYWLALRKIDALGPHTWSAHLAGLAVVAGTFVVAAWAFRLVEEPARGRMRRLVPRLTGLLGRTPKPVVDMDPALDHAPGPAFPVVRSATAVAVLAPGGDADTEWVPVVPSTSGQSVSGRPASGQPVPGQLISCQHVSCPPVSGQPVSGRPASCPPAAGQQVSCQPVSFQPGSCQPGSARPPSPRPPSPRPTSSGPISLGPAMTIGRARPTPFPRARGPQTHELGPAAPADPVLRAPMLAAPMLAAPVRSPRARAPVPAAPVFAAPVFAAPVFAPPAPAFAAPMLAAVERVDVLRGH